MSMTKLSNTRKTVKTFVATLLAGAALLAAPAEANPDNFLNYTGENTAAIDHSAWGTFLGKYLRVVESGPNLVAYGEVTDEDHQALKAYIDTLEAVDPTRLTDDEAFAYWVNLYNSVTIDVILENYPLSSIRSLGAFNRGPWGRKIISVNGDELSLDNVEHDILREYWDEPRVHYAVNCASIGCPNLALAPYTGAELDEQLESSAVRYVNDPRGVTFKDNGDVVVSSIYKWFKEDFGTSQTQVLAHIRRYADDDLRTKLANASKISGYEYDWGLNDAN